MDSNNNQKTLEYLKTKTLSTYYADRVQIEFSKTIKFHTPYSNLQILTFSN